MSIGEEAVGGWGVAGGEVYLHCTAMSNQNHVHAGTESMVREKKLFFFFYLDVLEVSWFTQPWI